MDQETLRDRFARRMIRDPFPDPAWLEPVGTSLPYVPSVEVSETYGYLWDVAPDEQVLFLRDFPNVALRPTLLGRLWAREGDVPAVFLEGAAPASGLAAAFLIGPDGTISGEVSAAELVAAVGERGERPALMVPPERGVGIAFLEDGLTHRAGTFVYAHSPPFGDMEDFYRDAGVREPGRLLQVLQLMFFHEFDERFGRRVVPPQLIYYVPVAHDGTVQTVGVKDTLPFIAPGYEYVPEDMHDTIADALRPSVLNTLFALACLNATASQRGAILRRRADIPGVAPRLALTLDGLRSRLNRPGNAPSVGLGHAMTVCRGIFGGGQEDSG